MNDETIGVWHDPEVEVRIVAMVLGEASAFEKAELERMIAEDSGLKQFYVEMCELHGGIASAVLPDDDAEWKLSGERRNCVLEKLGQKTEPVVSAAVQPEPSTSHHQWRSFMSIAACLLVTLFIMALMFPLEVTQNVKSAPEIISYSAAPSDGEEQSELYFRESEIVWADRAPQSEASDDPFADDSAVFPKTPATPVDKLEGKKDFNDVTEYDAFAENTAPAPTDERRWVGEEKAKMPSKKITQNLPAKPQSKAVPLVGDVPVNGRLFAKKNKNKGEKSEASYAFSVDEESIERPEMTNGVARKPSAPSSSMAKVIASNMADPTAVPVPDASVAQPSLEFGNGDDFGDGWGDGDGSGGGGFSGENSFKTARMPKAKKGLSNVVTGGNRSGDYAITRENIDSFMNNPEPESEVVVLESHQLGFASLSDDGIAAEGIAIEGSVHAKTDTVTAEIATNLYRAGGLQNLGKYDEAEEEYKEVLRVDRYNKAARRGMEKIASMKSDYYRAAYDQTRAELLMEVDEAWEIDVAPKVDFEKEESLRDEVSEGELIDEIKADLLKEANKSWKITEEKTKKLENKNEPPVVDEISATNQTHSTFSLNVSDASYQLAKAALLERGEWPTAESIRTEEFINAFDYGDPKPSMAQKVACVQEQAVHPFLQQRNLLRVSMSTAAQGRSTPLNLVVLLDQSGSMERPDRAATVLRAVEELSKQLGPNDRVSLMSFARDTRLLVDGLSGDRAGELVGIMKNRPSEGGTNLEQAVQVAQQHLLARQKKGVQSRIVVLTDGAANLGDANPESLTAMVEKMRDAGIAFDACGIGFDGLDDGILEALTRKGDGRYYLLDKPEDAGEGFGKKIAGALRPAAKNVKVQLVFNPDRVGKYKLLGFEKHRLKKEDFRNDSVDAAEMAAEESGSALYQIEPLADGSGELGTVFVRFQDMETGQMVERSWTIPYQANAKTLAASKPSIQLAAVAGLLGEKLHQSDAGSVDFSQLSKVLGNLNSQYSGDTKVLELLQMVRKVQQ